MVNPNLLLALVFAAASARLGACDRVASAAAGDEEDDEYYDLDGMSDEELEEICTSRGFELVREIDDDTGRPVVYTHQDYVDAAGECLQIEADLEEILETHPEILEDVKKESERMRDERDRLLDALNQREEADGPQEQIRQEGNGEESEDGEATSKPDAIVGADVPPEQRGSNTEEVGDGEAASNPDDTVVDTNDPAQQPDNKLNYDLKEITSEVIQQMKSDFARVVNFIAPKELRERVRLQVKQRILPAMKTFVSVARGMGTTAYEMTRRYLKAFVNGAKAGGDGDASGDGATSVGKDESARTEGRTAAA